MSLDCEDKGRLHFETERFKAKAEQKKLASALNRAENLERVGERELGSEDATAVARVTHPGAAVCVDLAEPGSKLGTALVALTIRVEPESLVAAIRSCSTVLLRH
jgi:hypothetical protein